MPSDLKNWGQAQQAGWQRSQSAAPGGGFMTVMEIHLSQDRQSGHALRVTAVDPQSQGQADQKALDAANAWRRARYGCDPVGPPDTSKGPRSGQPLIPDAT